MTTSSPPPVRGAILAGGGATRFGGEPKGLARVGGRRILDRLAAAFQQGLGRAPILVANAPDAAQWRPGLTVVPDLLPGRGALGGILSAIAAGPGPVVCVAWDMPFVPAELVAALAAGLERYDAVLPESDGRRGLEPLCAGYGPACRAPIERRLAEGDRRAVAFHGEVRVTTLSPEAVQAFGDPAYLFFNVNTRDDLTRANELWEQHASSP